MTTILSLLVNYKIFLKIHDKNSDFQFKIFFFAQFSKQTLQIPICLKLISNMFLNKCKLRIHKLIFIYHYITLHSSEIRGLCLMKCSSGMLQNLPYFWNMKTHIVIFFISCYLIFFSNAYQCPGLV